MLDYPDGSLSPVTCGLIRGEDTQKQWDEGHVKTGAVMLPQAKAHLAYQKLEEAGRALP